MGLFSRANRKDARDLKGGKDHDFFPAGKGRVRIIDCRQGSSSFKNKNFVCIDGEVVTWNNDEANIGETYTWYLDMAWPSTIDDLLRFSMAIEGVDGEEFEEYLEENEMTKEEYLDAAFPEDSSEDHPWKGTIMNFRGRPKKDSDFVVVRWSKPTDDEEDEDDDE